MKIKECNEPGIELSQMKGNINKKLNNLLDFEDFEKTFKPEEQKKTKRTEVGLDVVKETNEPGIEVSDLKKGIDKKLNNLLGFDDFEKTWKPEDQKKTKRTDVGLDIVKEDSSNLPAIVARAKQKSRDEYEKLPGVPPLKPDDRWINRFYIKSESINQRTGKSNFYVVSYDTATHQWCCSCRGWVGHRKCKHLGSMGLLGAPEDRKRIGY